MSKNFLRVLKFLQIKEGGPNFWVEPILQKLWIIWSPLLYFNFKSFTDPNSSSCIGFQCILDDSGVLFSEPWNLYKPKEGGRNFWGGEPILQKVWIIWCPLLYFNFKTFMDPNSLSFYRSQYILHGSRVLFSESWKFYKLKMGDLISGRSQFCRKSELFGPLFCISILKVLPTQIFRHSLDFNAFWMIKECFSQSLEISAN